MKFIHNCPHELRERAPTLDTHLLFLASAIKDLQRHCDYLHQILDANGIKMPDNLEPPVPSQTPPQ